MNQHSRRPEGGHLLVNSIIWFAVTVLVLAVAFPAAGKIRGDRRVAELIDTTRTLETACRQHYADTKTFALEFSPSRTGQYSSPRYHQLSMSPGTSGWRGPYLEQPLSSEDNPFGGAVYLQNKLGADPARGFKLRSSTPSAPLRDGPGQYIVFYGVPKEIALAVNERLDGDDQEWQEQGRVEWQPSGGGALIIKLNLNEVKEVSKK
ncbi:MAG: hypothetical protein V3W41_14285 [Planctomycetota bacterium]